ncbi:MAG: hypothetical protein R3E50_00820 [Halioglobus sp.]
MKNALKIVTGLVLLCIVLIYLFREPLREMAYARLTQDMFVAADHDDFEFRPAVGSHFPACRRTIGVAGSPLLTNSSVVMVRYSSPVAPLTGVRTACAS